MVPPTTQDPTLPLLSWTELRSLDSNWAYFVACPEALLRYFVTSRPRHDEVEIGMPSDERNVAARIVRGRHSRTKIRLFQEWAAAWQFPEYFGENWPAFDECIGDLDWLLAPAYVAVVTHVDAVLQDSKVDFRYFVDVLENTALEWKVQRIAAEERRPLPLRVVFHAEPSLEEKALQKLRDAGAFVEQRRLAMPPQ